MEKQKNLPKLRFPEFQDTWIDEQLDSITTKIGDGIHGTPKYNEDGEYFFINGNNIVDGRIYITENTKRIDYEEFRIHRRDLNERTILLSINGTIGNLAYYNGEAVILGKSAAYINIDNSYDLIFSYYSLMTNKVQSYFDSELTGTTIKNLSLKTIRSTKLFIPTLPEQQKIASFFTAIDQKISQLKLKKTLLEQYKKGVMQKLFSQEIRFKDDSGQEFPKWEKMTGDALFETVSNKNHNSDLPILAITQEHGAIPRDMIDYYITVSEQSVESYKVVEKGDFIISLRSFQGGIEYSEYTGICSPAYIVLRATQRIDHRYFKYYFKTDKYITDLNRKLEGIRDGKMISYKYFSEIEINVPSLPEQTKISNFLSAIDDKISHTQNQIEKAEVWKKGLMQQMFV